MKSRKSMNERSFTTLFKKSTHARAHKIKNLTLALIGSARQPWKICIFQENQITNLGPVPSKKQRGKLSDKVLNFFALAVRIILAINLAMTILISLLLILGALWVCKWNGGNPLLVLLLREHVHSNWRAFCSVSAAKQVPAVALGRVGHHARHWSGHLPRLHGHPILHLGRQLHRHHVPGPRPHWKW